MTFGLTEPLLTSNFLKFGDLDGPLEQTECLENENLNCSQITAWAVDDSDVLTAIELDSDVLNVLTATELDSDVKTDVLDVKTDVLD